MLRRCERVEAGGDDFLVAQKKAGGNLTATPSSRRRTVSCGQSSGLGRAQRLALAEKVGAAHPVAGGFCHRRYVAFENPRGGGRHVERHGSCQAILRGLRDGQGLGRVPSLLHAQGELCGAGRAGGRSSNSPGIRRLDEGAAHLHARRTLCREVVATDDDRNSVCAYGVFSATHTGQGGPCPPTGKSTTTDYVYVMDFDGDKIRHMTKIWNAGWAMKELGWG